MRRPKLVTTAVVLIFVAISRRRAVADVTVDTAFGTVLGSASFDVNHDGVLDQPAETDSPGTVSGSATPTFTGNSTGHIGGARGSAIETATVTATGGSLTATVSIDCNGEVALTGNDAKDILRFGGAQGSFLLEFTVSKPSTFSVNGSVSVVPAPTTLAQGGGGDNRALLSMASFVDIGADDAATDPQSDSANVSGTLTAGTYDIGAQCQSLAPRHIGDDFGPGRAGGRVSFTLTVSEGLCTGPIARWVGPLTGAFGDPLNWDPPDVPTFGTGDGECEDAIFDKHQRLIVDLTPAAAASTASRAPRAASHTIGRLGVRKARQLQFVNGVLFLNGGDVDNRASLIVGDDGLLAVLNGTVQARHAVIGSTGLGTVKVEGADSFFKTTNTLTIGGATGDGVLEITNKGQGDSDLVRIGAGKKGTATVSNATWKTGKMFVGFKSPGDLTIASGGEVDSSDVVIDADLPPVPVPPLSSGDAPCLDRAGAAGAEVRGTHSVWNANDFLVRGLGCVEIRDEAGIVTTGNVSVGSGAFDETSLLVNHAGVLTVGGSLVVGNDGIGRVTITENIASDPRVAVAGTLVVGGIGSDANGAVIVGGDPATNGNTLTANDIRVADGGTGNGVLTLTNGARVLTTATAKIGTDSTTEGNDIGEGVVFLKGDSPATPELTRWSIGESLTIGPSTISGLGVLSIKNATVAVGTGQTHGTVTIRAGGQVATGGGTNNQILTNGGTIQNDGSIAGPMLLFGSYSGSGRLEQQVTVPAPPPPPAVPAAAGIAGSRAAKPPLPPQGPVVIDGDADLSGTTLVLQFLNGFAPHQGDTFPVVEVHGQRTGNFANVEVRGLAPGALFDVTTIPGVATALNDTVALPIVAVKAPKKAKESAKKGFKVTFKRTAPTTAPLTVHYAVAGTARNGIDYVELPGSVEIPIKKKSATIVVIPFPDGFPEGPETIEVEVLPGVDYAPAIPSIGTTTLVSVDKKRK